MVSTTICVDCLLKLNYSNLCLSFAYTGGRLTNPEPVPLKRYIGRCIYCGSTENLTDEHILPRGLKGPWKLLKGSCLSCNQITSAFEKHVLREQFILPRAALGLPTYHPKKRPQKFSFGVEKEGHKETIVLPVSNCPPLFMMLTLKKPRYIEDYDYEKGVKVTGASLHGPELSKIKEKLKIDSLSITANISGNCFERMLAKIAYGMTILTYGPDALGECYVLPCILGQKDDAGYWVGSSGRDFAALPVEKQLHRIFMMVKGNEVGASIRLFANYHTPEYLVIIGKLKQV